MKLSENYSFSSIQGLSEEEVVRRRQVAGINQIRLPRFYTIWTHLRDLLGEPMVILLLSASLIYLMLGERTEAYMMISAVLFVTGISLFQSVRSRNALILLQKMSQSKVKVIRSGKERLIDKEELVPGDCFIVEEGDLLPADGQVLKSHDFSVNESILTGEAFSVVKTNQAPDNMLYAGTLVVSGSTIASVTTTGTQTRMGRIGMTMQKMESSRTPLQKQIDRFVRQMAVFGVGAFVLVWFLNYRSSGELWLSLLQGLTLAMSALPEEIPVAFSTFMALGAWRLIRKKILAREPQTVESLGAADVICLDKTGTITQNKMVVTFLYSLKEKEMISIQSGIKLRESFQEVIKDAMIASEPVPFDPMEQAIHKTYSEFTGKDIREDLHMEWEYPLHGNPPMMTHGFRNKEGQVLISAKGSWEKILEICTLSSEEREMISEVAHGLSKDGLRVLGTANVRDIPEIMPEKQEDFNWQFSGLIALSDPMKENIPEVFNHFHVSGISVKIITGDHANTAIAVAKKSGIKNPEEVLTGKEIMEMEESHLRRICEKVHVYARMFPEAKLRVIRALQQNKHVVAMTGDGVNDAPALRAADIGIAMGERGTEFARKSANIILLDDQLDHMVEALLAGRKIYYNLKKAFRYIITIHIPIILVVSLPLILGWIYPNIFTPVHVIFLELIMGPTCSIIYENEPLETFIKKEMPRDTSQPLFSWNEMSISILQGLMITAGVLFMYQYGVRHSLSENGVRTLTFSTLIFANIFLTLSNRSFYFSIFHTIRYKNILVSLILTITLILWWCAIEFETGRQLFHFEKVALRWLLTCVGVAAISVLWMEFFKGMKRHGRMNITRTLKSL